MVTFQLYYSQKEFHDLFIHHWLLFKNNMNAGQLSHNFNKSSHVSLNHHHCWYDVLFQVIIHIVADQTTVTCLDNGHLMDLMDWETVGRLKVTFISRNTKRSQDERMRK